MAKWREERNHFAPLPKFAPEAEGVSVVVACHDRREKLETPHQLTRFPNIVEFVAAPQLVIYFDELSFVDARRIPRPGKEAMTIPIMPPRGVLHS
jgi:hypothetical protein